MKPVIIEESKWTEIYQEIKRREKPSTYLSREKMREVLGFTVRRHVAYSPQYSELYEETFDPVRIHLDFYDEQKRIMFLLKYGDGM